MLKKSGEVWKAEFEKCIRDQAKSLYRKTLDELSNRHVFVCVAYAVKDIVIDEWIATQKTFEEKDVKTVYYLSMEFLMGRALGNMILNLSCRDEIREALLSMDIDLNVIEDMEPDAALGNGGLGRLAACFLDSLSTLGYPAYGCGIRYRYGMFRQKIENGFQKELPEDWLRHNNPLEIKREEYACEVKFGGFVRIEHRDGRNYFIQTGYQSVNAIPYDIPVVGYGNHIVNTLRIWDAEPMVHFNLDEFDKGSYMAAVEQENLAKTITEVLYPNDNHYAGKELRLKQQYFFVSASIQTALKKFLKKHQNLRELPNKVVFQMNDTHPALTIAELMRLLMDEYLLEWDDAWDITTHCTAYTNHTIMSEALEKWPVDLFSGLLPRCYQIIEEINKRFCVSIEESFPGEQWRIPKMAIIYDGKIRMAHLAIVAAFSVNGVAKLHTDILKKRELKDFYEMMPEKFHNKTNGITQRRFLLHANPLLASWVTNKIGDGWITDLSKMKELTVFATDRQAQKEVMEIKFQNKLRLAKYIKEHNHLNINPDSIFDIQVKRMHEYKRQLLNILHIMYLYNEIKEHPNREFTPRTFIFGGKAAAGYRLAKLIVKLINSVADVINQDESIHEKLKVVFIENYCVSNAEIIFAAADISEQISTASKEASGTGNMKFMLNGAITLGTMDGANVEIVEEVGEDNAVIFGLSAEEVIRYETDGGYEPMDIFNTDMDLRRVLVQLINGLYSPNDPGLFRPIYRSLLENNETGISDKYFVLKDFRAYAEAQKRMEEKYNDQENWAKSVILNIAHVGKFSSDRTIEEYAKNIWKLQKVKAEWGD